MEAACKAASRTAQLLTKDTPQEEISQMMTVMASIKEQLSKVRLVSAKSGMIVSNVLDTNLDKLVDTYRNNNASLLMKSHSVKINHLDLLM